MHMVTINPFDDSDRSAVHQLLRSHQLPLDGFDDARVVAVVAKDGVTVVGSAAIEVYGRVGLLRSVAVVESRRGHALGQQLTAAAIDLARTRGLQALYLLTETAAGFFPRFGFVPIARADVPDAVKASIEFTTACPATAQAFVLPIRGV
jgi:amino-acid N-acetyltransferase